MWKGDPARLGPTTQLGAFAHCCCPALESSSVQPATQGWAWWKGVRNEEPLHEKDLGINAAVMQLES